MELRLLPASDVGVHTVASDGLFKVLPKVFAAAYWGDNPAA